MGVTSSAAIMPTYSHLYQMMRCLGAALNCSSKREEGEGEESKWRPKKARQTVAAPEAGEAQAALSLPLEWCGNFQD